MDTSIVKTMGIGPDWSRSSFWRISVSHRNASPSTQKICNRSVGVLTIAGSRIAHSDFRLISPLMGSLLHNDSLLYCKCRVDFGRVSLHGKNLLVYETGWRQRLGPMKHYQRICQVIRDKHRGFFLLPIGARCAPNRTPQVRLHWTALVRPLCRRSPKKPCPWWSIFRLYRNVRRVRAPTIPSKSFSIGFFGEVGAAKKTTRAVWARAS